MKKNVSNRFSKKDQEVFKNISSRMDDVDVSKVLERAKEEFEKLPEDIKERLTKNQGHKMFDPNDINDHLSLENMKGFMELTEIENLYKPNLKDKKPNPSKKPLFTGGQFRTKSNRPIVATMNGHAESLMGVMDESKMKAYFKKSGVLDENGKMKKVKEKKVKKKWRPIKSIKNWYVTYLKPEKKKNKEEPWFPLEEANRMRVLAGLKPKDPEPEPIKKGFFYKFRVFTFRQLSLLIWRIHPESKVKTHVTQPKKTQFKNITPDLEFLMQNS